MDAKSPIVQEAEQLTWALLDQEISDAQQQRLEELLRQSPEARRRYQEVLALDSQLHAYFTGLKQPPQQPQKPYAA